VPRQKMPGRLPLRNPSANGLYAVQKWHRPAGSKWIYLAGRYLLVVSRNLAQLRNVGYFPFRPGGERNLIDRRSQVDRKTLKFNHASWPSGWVRAKIPLLGPQERLRAPVAKVLCLFLVEASRVRDPGERRKVHRKGGLALATSPSS